MSPPASSATTRPAKSPKLAREVVPAIRLSDEAKGLLRPELTAVEYFDLLVKEKLFPDAVRVISQVMTASEAVWWGILCLWEANRPRPGPATERVLRTATQWLQSPTDENRHEVAAAGRAAGPETPAGMLGSATLLAGGSLAPEGQPVVTADPHLTGKIVAEAVLAVARGKGTDPSQAGFREFLAIAVDVCRGANVPRRMG